MRHLYVHIPFCAHRCGYCDFVTVARNPELHERYVEALLREHALRVGEGHRYETIFLGGGTPTLLEAPALERLLDWVRDHVAPGAEVTIECNPETVDEALVQRLVAGGVTRVSLGAQSFQPHLLEVLERLATPDAIRAAVPMLRAGGIHNLSLDVIWGIPGQTDDDVRADIAEVVALGPDHVSAYELDFKPGTRLTHAWGGADVAVGDGSDEFYDIVVDAMIAAGYEWYETANFARAGRESRHNLAYWTQRDYLGIGIGAVGTIDGERRTNMPNLVRYLDALTGESGPPSDPPARLEPIDGETRQRERVMLALRLGRPCVLPEMDLGTIIDAEWLTRLEEGGLLERNVETTDVVVTLTRRGRMMLNYVLSRLLN